MNYIYRAFHMINIALCYASGDGDTQTLPLTGCCDQSALCDRVLYRHVRQTKLLLCSVDQETEGKGSHRT